MSAKPKPVKPRGPLFQYNTVEISNQLSELQVKQWHMLDEIIELRLKQTDLELRGTCRMFADDEKAIAQVKDLETNTISKGTEVRAKLKKRKANKEKKEAPSEPEPEPEK